MEHLDHPSPPPPISMMPKWRVFATSRLHHFFCGGGGLIVPFRCVQDCRSRYWTRWKFEGVRLSTLFMQLFYYLCRIQINCAIYYKGESNLLKLGRISLYYPSASFKTVCFLFCNNENFRTLESPKHIHFSNHP